MFNHGENSATVWRADNILSSPTQSLAMSKHQFSTSHIFVLLTRSDSMSTPTLSLRLSWAQMQWAQIQVRSQPFSSVLFQSLCSMLH